MEEKRFKKNLSQLTLHPALPLLQIGLRVGPRLHPHKGLVLRSQKIVVTTKSNIKNQTSKIKEPFHYVA
jgi:hypothetical protein